MTATAQKTKPIDKRLADYFSDVDTRIAVAKAEVAELQESIDQHDAFLRNPYKGGLCGIESSDV